MPQMRRMAKPGQMVLTGREHWTLVSVLKRTGYPIVTPCMSQTHTEVTMEAQAKERAGKYQSFIVIATREGASPQLAVFESPS